MSQPFDIIGIGNAIVDAIAPISDDALQHMGIEKGVMQLVDESQAEALYAAMQTPMQAPGGSVANSLAGLGALGLRTAFIGKVNDDDLGHYYAKAMEESGTHFPIAPQAMNVPTSRSMIFVSPDGERSMNTYLGAGGDINAQDVPDIFQGAQYLLLEGYLFDTDAGKAAFRAAAEKMREAGGQVVLSLSDPFCVDRHRADFQTLVANHVDIAIGNEHEWCSLYENDDISKALDTAAENCALVVSTRGGDPVWVQHSTQRLESPVKPCTPVDATGAGDQFAAGFLYGLATGKPLSAAAQMGVIASGEVISHIGPRPEADVKTLIKAAGL